MIELHFLLDVEDDWPPVSVEGVPVTNAGDFFRIETPPLFVKGLSVGDVICVSAFDAKHQVSSWNYVSLSKRSTIWLLRMDEPSMLEKVILKLQDLDCQVIQLPNIGCYSIDVPEHCVIEDIDECLSVLDENKVAIAYPSFRHSEEKSGSV